MSLRKFKKVKHVHQPGDLHELTFSCYRRLRLLTNGVWRKVLSKTISNACESHGMELIAFVYMPDHVHLLVFPANREPDMGAFLAAVKQPVSSRIRSLLERSQSPLLKQLIIRERPGKNVFRFWQEGPGCDRNLFQPNSIQASINYIHNNPVAKGLCQQAVDWKWSSARYYHSVLKMQQYEDLPTIHGPRPEALEQGMNR